MNIIDFRKICFDKHNRAYFLRVQPDDLKDTLSQIFYVLSNLSWISNFDEDYIRESFQERAKATLADIYAKITTSSTDEVSSDAGEYSFPPIEWCMRTEILSFALAKESVLP